MWLAVAWASAHTPARRGFTLAQASALLQPRGEGRREGLPSGLRVLAPDFPARAHPSPLRQLGSEPASPFLATRPGPAAQPSPLSFAYLFSPGHLLCLQLEPGQVLPVLIELLQSANHLWRQEKGRCPPSMVKPALPTAFPETAPTQREGSCSSSHAPSELRGNRLYQPNDVQTYVAIAGDVTFSLQPLDVVSAFVVRLQVRVVQAVVLCAQLATVGISQVKIARGTVKLEERCCRV